MSPRYFPTLLISLLLTGCGGPLTPTQRLAGEWVGRPETADERIAREWPGDGPPSGEQGGAPSTDLEVFANVRVAMTLGRTGDAELSLDGRRVRRGVWSVQPGEGRRLLVEIALAPEGAPQGAAVEGRERRRFEVEMLAAADGEPDRFVLRESEADLRFGRMIFRRAGQLTPTTD